MLRIDPEFAEKIPPISEDEIKKLEENILSDGRVIMPIVVWGDLIVDGHSRFRIIQKHPELPYTTYEKQFENRYAAMAWIYANQLGRRNLTPQQRKYLIGQRYEAEKMAHGGDRKSAEVKSKGQSDPLIFKKSDKDPHVTRKKIAEETHTNATYVRRAGNYAQGVDAAEEAVPGTRQKLLTGEIHATECSVAAVAKAPPEERKEMTEQLGKAKKKLLPGISNSNKQDEPREPWTAGAGDMKTLRKIAADLEKPKAGVTLDDVFLELEDAAETMVERWEICRKLHGELMQSDECRDGVRKLARQVTDYLKTYEGEIQSG